MSENNLTKVDSLLVQPGIQRDGTQLDSQSYVDGQWVRFPNGRPRKMRGYRSITDLMTGPLRAAWVSADGATNNALHGFSKWGVQKTVFNKTGAGGGIYDRTPATFLADNPGGFINWQCDSMFAGGGSGFSALIASCTNDLDNLGSPDNGCVYAGDITATSALTKLTEGGTAIKVSGGCCVLQPFLFVYGNNGLIKNSKANDYSDTGWSGDDANEANVAGVKIVRGLALRGGSQAPAGLFWGLNCLIRVTFVGDVVKWRYDTLSSETSILSKNAVIEYDGVYYWPGVDRFLMYNGVIQEVPNGMNLDFFYDNLNSSQAQKVWAQKVPRYGEIWWFFPSGDSVECDRAVIYNVRMKTWYDVELARTAGYPAELFHYPIMAGGENSTITTLLTYNSGTLVGTFGTGQTVTGGTSGAIGRIVRILGSTLSLVVTSGTFVNAEVVSNGAGASATLNAVPAVGQELVNIWQHEFGYDKILKSDVTAIPSYFVTDNIGFPTGGPVGAPSGVNVQTHLVKFEPDFKSQSGDLNLYVTGRGYAANVNDDVSDAIPVPVGQGYVSVRQQRREMYLKIESNTQGGYYEMGKPILTLEPGDERASDGT